MLDDATLFNKNQYIYALMQFVYPAFLWALSAIALPVIIHLFHFRRYKKIVFSDIRFLKQLEEQNKSKQKIKDWLVLLCRVLLVSCLVLAFAQPYIPLGENSRQNGLNTVSLFVDNSLSMNAEGSEGPLLEMAKAKARAIINAYGNRDRFQVLTNGLSGAEHRYLNKSDALARIDAIEPSAASATGQAIHSRMLSGFGLQNSDRQAAYLISDFQAGQFDLSAIPSDSTVHYTFVPVHNKSAANISIDTVYPASPFIKANEPVTLVVRLTNHGKEAVEGLVVTVTINDVQKALLNVNIGGGESVTAEAAIRVSDTQWQKGEIRITDYPITYDDRLYFAFRSSLQNQVLLISNQENRFIGAVFSDDPGYKLTVNTFGNINYQDFNKYSLIILDEPATISSGLQAELDKALDQGAGLLIIPPATGAQALNAFLQNLQLPVYAAPVAQNLKVSEVDLHSSLFRNVFRKLAGNSDLPQVSQYIPLQNQGSTKGRALISLNNGQALLWQAGARKGSVYLLSAPLNTAFTSLPRHSLFVPMMLNMAMGNQKTGSLYATIGNSSLMELPGNVSPKSRLAEVKAGKTMIVSEIGNRNGRRFIPVDHLEEEGWYEARDQKDRELLGITAFNLSRNESSMSFLDEASIRKQTASLTHREVNESSASVLGAGISEALSGKALWRWFILAGLFFLLAEILLLRLVK